MKLRNFALNRWIEGNGEGRFLYDATTGRKIASVSSDGLDFDEMLNYARVVGNRNLRKMTFPERGNMLKALAMYLNSKKEAFYEISYAAGATRHDSYIDIEGGLSALLYYAGLGVRIPDESYYCKSIQGVLNRSAFRNHKLWLPRDGVSLHISSFSFPVWSMLQALAVSWLSGMPSVIKPSALTSFLSEVVAREIVSSSIVPNGAFQLICGAANGILDYVRDEDVVTFTGSSETRQKLKAHPSITSGSIPFLSGTDCLNVSVLGPDAKTDTIEFDLFIQEVVGEMTMRGGQNCTAARRLLVPRQLIDPVQDAMVKALKEINIGDPRLKGVNMGPLVSKCQVEEVRKKVSLLSEHTPITYQGSRKKADAKGAFFAPVLMRNDLPLQITATHQIEVFGPVCTLMPYQDIDDAIAIAKSGKNSFYTAVFTDNDTFAKQFVIDVASDMGKLSVINKKTANRSATGRLFPVCFQHEDSDTDDVTEAWDGLSHFMKMATVQGAPDIITAFTHVYQQGSNMATNDRQLFSKYFEEIAIGDLVVTGKRTITAADIYDASIPDDDISANKTVPEYLVLSAAAGLFADSKKDTVLWHYGLEDCVFMKQVPVGTVIGVRLIVKERTDREKAGEGNINKGLVKFLVEVYDQAGDTVVMATMLTLVKKKGK